ncbi:MAG: M23 family metallopeptidase [Negativicutes bacterium]
MDDKKSAPDRREYTLMFVPHNGQAIRSIKIPIKAIKVVSGLICLLLVVGAGFGLKYTATIRAAYAERAELEALRQTNGAQHQQLEQLTQATAELQRDMDRLNILDTEIRRMVNADEQPEVSRSGVVRPNISNGGQGGPIAKPSLNELNDYVANLKDQIKYREESLTNLREILIERNARFNATPSLWPASGEVTSRFGWRSSPFGGGSEWHPGIDIANSTGTPIIATAAGEVVHSGWYSGYGKMVKIDHGNGIVTLYAHNSQNNVREGQQVEKGEVIAYMGSTGWSTGSHVHYEVRVNGTAVNPANFL